MQWYGRECNNPTPNNGRYCIGKHRIFKSCNTQDCPAGTIDIREQQCTAQNNRTHTWAAVYNLSPKYQCELACKNQKTERVAWLKEKVRKVAWLKENNRKYFQPSEKTNLVIIR